MFLACPIDKLIADDAYAIGVAIGIPDAFCVDFGHKNICLIDVYTH